jgi:hypothetical protein
MIRGMVEKAFANRLPLRDDVVREYEAGIEGDESGYVGRLLHAHQHTLAAGDLGREILAHPLPGAVPRVIASQLLWSLCGAGEDDHRWRDEAGPDPWSFFLSLAGFQRYALEDGSVGPDGLIGELTAAECAVTLVGLCRLASAPAAATVDEESWDDAIGLAEQLQARCRREDEGCGERAGRILTRLRMRASRRCVGGRSE